MRTSTKLAVFVACLVVLAAGAFALGRAIEPQRPATVAADHSAMGEAAPPAVAAHGADAALPGLAMSANGYTLVPASPIVSTGHAHPFSFMITGPDGRPVTAFDVTHEKPMHLVVVRRDGAGFQHVHPEMAADGTWTVPFSVPAAGSYRAFADFRPTGGPATTLGVDLAAAGEFTPVTPAPSRVAELDGYTVELSGELVPGAVSPLTLTVRRDGRAVTDLQPYLGAYGHLVALRTGDLAYLHVHPDGSPTAGPEIRFAAEVPGAGTYRLYLDFRHGDVVRTAEFTVPTTGAATAAPRPAHEDDGAGH
ncbi:hypothetical protein SAMN05443637_105186 [Pseudonocardia thermophila]|uniref:Secreted protein n=1 Tax=Pseudonocardia thermophila TaxID=1848 RepID=A0A1M6RVV6_PSETH|nr:hypothetical protein [Pseudonocardia thermophila]SHK36632.1 hypothetical protein SAMN05443637_105186 [Pseudonocardia thermophila]